jgi:hypothetical protein
MVGRVVGGYETGELLSVEVLSRSLRPGEVCGTHKPLGGAAKRHFSVRIAEDV